MSCVGEDLWRDLQPACKEGGVLDVERGGKAKAAVGNGREELYIVLGCELSVEPLFEEVDGCVVEGCGGSCVDAHGTSCEGGISGGSGAPQGLRDVCCEASVVELL